MSVREIQIILSFLFRKVGIELDDRGAEVYLEYMDNAVDPFILDFDVSARLPSSSTNYTLVKGMLAKQILYSYLRLDIHHVIMQPNKRWVSLYCSAPLELNDTFSLELKINFNYHRVYERRPDERPPKSRRGRPEQYKKFRNMATRLLNCWFNNNRNKPLSG